MSLLGGRFLIDGWKIAPIFLTFVRSPQCFAKFSAKLFAMKPRKGQIDCLRSCRGVA